MQARRKARRQAFYRACIFNAEGKSSGRDWNIYYLSWFESQASQPEHDIDCHSQYLLIFVKSTVMKVINISNIRSIFSKITSRKLYIFFVIFSNFVTNITEGAVEPKTSYKRDVCPGPNTETQGKAENMSGGGGRISCSRKAWAKSARDRHTGSFTLLALQAVQDSVPVRGSKDYSFSGWNSQRLLYGENIRGGDHHSCRH